MRSTILIIICCTISCVGLVEGKRHVVGDLYIAKHESCRGTILMKMDDMSPEQCLLCDLEWVYGNDAFLFLKTKARGDMQAEHYYIELTNRKLYKEDVVLVNESYVDSVSKLEEIKYRFMDL